MQYVFESHLNIRLYAYAVTITDHRVALVPYKLKEAVGNTTEESWGNKESGTTQKFRKNIQNEKYQDLDTQGWTVHYLKRWTLFYLSVRNMMQKKGI